MPTSLHVGEWHRADWLPPAARCHSRQARVLLRAPYRSAARRPLPSGRGGLALSRCQFCSLVHIWCSSTLPPHSCVDGPWERVPTGNSTNVSCTRERVRQAGAAHATAVVLNEATLVAVGRHRIAARPYKPLAFAMGSRHYGS